jgi:hypothetical protein
MASALMSHGGSFNGAMEIASAALLIAAGICEIRRLARPARPTRPIRKLDTPTGESAMNTTSRSPRQNLLARLNLSTPIIQAPMAGVSTPAMAAAVSEAAAWARWCRRDERGRRAQGDPRNPRADQQAVQHQPVLPCPRRADAARERAWLEYLAPEFKKFGAAAPASLNEIYKTFLTDEAMFQMLLEEKPAVVSFHFGLPAQGEDRRAARRASCCWPAPHRCGRRD